MMVETKEVECPIYIVAPNPNEDLTQYIAMEIAQRTGASYVMSVKSDIAALVVELGGVWDRDDNELMIQDKTKTGVFKMVLDLWFKTKDWGDQADFRTHLSNFYQSNYVRIELTNRVRYSEVMREFFIYVISEIINELKKEL